MWAVFAAGGDGRDVGIDGGGGLRYGFLSHWRGCIDPLPVRITETKKKRKCKHKRSLF